MSTTMRQVIASVNDDTEIKIYRGDQLLTSGRWFHDNILDYILENFVHATMDEESNTCTVTICQDEGTITLKQLLAVLSYAMPFIIKNSDGVGSIVYNPSERKRPVLPDYVLDRDVTNISFGENGKNNRYLEITINT